MEVLIAELGAAFQQADLGFVVRGVAVSLSPDTGSRSPGPRGFVHESHPCDGLHLHRDLKA